MVGSFSVTAEKECIPMEARNPRELFLDLVEKEKPSPVLEIGTHQSVPGQSTHHMAWFPHIERENYTMSDIFSGEDVDEVADIHNIPDHWNSKYQAFISLSVFEHLDRPWIAARQIERLLAPGGLCYIRTHQSFPLHGFPHDFFRFSEKGLSLILNDAGLEVLSSGYEDRCKIIPPDRVVHYYMVDQWNENHPSYIHVHIVARKPY
ncbi:methyltransferase domain-containing protein [Brevundimonas intermedia]|nr:methyltransferase domain-containing protein [Brevundimonas intermedia]